MEQAPLVIIVEGKNDRARLRPYLHNEIPIICTFGTLNATRIEQLKEQVGDSEIYLFMDNDRSGKRIRGILREEFPDSNQIYTNKGYAGVEGTPEEFLLQQLEKAGLQEYIIYPQPRPFGS